VEIDVKKITNVIEKSSNVIITAHKNLDLDALGSMLAMYYISTSLNKKTFILLDDEKFEFGVNRALEKVSDLNITIDKSKKILKTTDDNTLLIILDVNKDYLLQNNEILNKIKKVIIIDHHIKGNTSIKNYLYEYINTEESSTCEIILDIINKLNIYIPSHIATVMLAGIAIDTNNFYLKTTINTYEALAKLKTFNADSSELQYLLKQDFSKYKEIQKIVINTKFYNDIGISFGRKIYDKEDIAKSADSILLFQGVEASFVIGRVSKDEIGISARSLGNLDVQKVMVELGGGGHKTDAATQIKSSNIKEVYNKLLEILKI